MQKMQISIEIRTGITSTDAKILFLFKYKSHVVAPPYLTWSNGVKIFKQHLFIKIT